MSRGGTRPFAVAVSPSRASATSAPAERLRACPGDIPPVGYEAPMVPDVPDKLTRTWLGPDKSTLHQTQGGSKDVAGSSPRGRARPHAVKMVQRGWCSAGGLVPFQQLSRGQMAGGPGRRALEGVGAVEHICRRGHHQPLDTSQAPEGGLSFQPGGWAGKLCRAGPTRPGPPPGTVKPQRRCTVYPARMVGSPPVGGELLYVSSRLPLSGPADLKINRPKTPDAVRPPGEGPAPGPGHR